MFLWPKPRTFRCSCQASPEHFEQCAEFLPLRNRGLGPLAVPVRAIPLARKAARYTHVHPLPDRAASSEDFEAQQRLHSPWVLGDVVNRWGAEEIRFELWPPPH